MPVQGRVGRRGGEAGRCSPGSHEGEEEGGAGQGDLRQLPDTKGTGRAGDDGSCWVPRGPYLFSEGRPGGTGSESVPHREEAEQARGRGGAGGI